MRQAAKHHLGRFTKGNQAAAKERWDADQLHTFQRNLKATRERLGFTPLDMGKAMGFSGEYISLMEGAYTEQRQPSKRFIERLEELKQTAKPKENWHIPASTLKQIAKVDKTIDLWAHVLAKKFICPECKADVRKGIRPAGWEIWWGRTPSQKHCPQHQPKRTKPKRKAKQ